jgi:hypothetical protein
VRDGRDAALASVPKDSPWRAFAEGVDLAPMLVDARVVHVEYALAYNPVTFHAVHLTGATDRNYSGLPDGYVPGTLDLVIEKLDGSVWAWDHKTGAVYVPASCGQMKIAACALASVFQTDAVTVGIIQIDDEGQYLEPESITYVRDGENDLDAARLDIRQAYELAAKAAAVLAGGGTPSVRTTSECNHCPAMRSCPAVSSLVRGLAGIGSTGPVSVEEAGAAWQQVKLAEKVIEAAKRDLRVWFAHNGQLPAPGGGAYVISTVSKEAIDADIAAPQLRDMLGDETFLKIVEFKITKASLERQLGKKEAGAALARLRASGSLKPSTYETVRHKK